MRVDTTDNVHSEIILAAVPHIWGPLRVNLSSEESISESLLWKLNSTLDNALFTFYRYIPRRLQAQHQLLQFQSRWGIVLALLCYARRMDWIPERSLINEKSNAFMYPQLLMVEDGIDVMALAFPVLSAWCSLIIFQYLTPKRKIDTSPSPM